MNDPTSQVALVQRVTGTILVACTTFVTYDYFLTLEQEVRYVWLRPWTAGKVLFLLVRYLFFLDTPVLMADYVMTGPDDTSCRLSFDWVAALELPGLLVAWIVVGFRTWAIWNRNRLCGLIVCITVLGTAGVGLWDVVRFISGLTATTQPANGIPGCFLILSPSAVQSTQKLYVASATYEAAILFATLIRGLHHLRNKPSSLTSTLYRDAFIASALLFTTSVLTAYNASIQNDYFISYSAIHRTLMAVIPGRIMLNLRKEAYNLDNWDATTEMIEPLTLTHSEDTDYSGWD